MLAAYTSSTQSFFRTHFQERISLQLGFLFCHIFLPLFFFTLIQLSFLNRLLIGADKFSARSRRPSKKSSDVWLFGKWLKPRTVHDSLVYPSYPVWNKQKGTTLLEKVLFIVLNPSLVNFDSWLGFCPYSQEELLGHQCLELSTCLLSVVIVCQCLSLCEWFLGVLILWPVLGVLTWQSPSFSILDYSQCFQITWLILFMNTWPL